MNENTDFDFDAAWDEIEITDDDVIESEDGELGAEESETATTETETADQPDSDGGEQTDGNAESKDKNADPKFILKHLGEEHTVNRDEVITLAQKGMDYDRIHGKYEELTAENTELKTQMSDYEKLKDQIEFFTDIAKESGMSVDELIEQTLAAQAANKNGTSIAAELPNVKLSIERKAFEKEKSKWETSKGTAASAADAENARREEVSKDLALFAEEFPDAAKDIEHNVPQEVWDEVNKGQTLTAAYRKYAAKQKDAEIQSLKSQLEQAKQNEKNKSRSTGSQSTGSINANDDDFFNSLWND